MEQYADKLTLNEAKNVKQSSIVEYRENWNIINQLAQKAMH